MPLVKKFIVKESQQPDADFEIVGAILNDGREIPSEEISPEMWAECGLQLGSGENQIKSN